MSPRKSLRENGGFFYESLSMALSHGRLLDVLHIARAVTSLSLADAMCTGQFRYLCPSGREQQKRKGDGQGEFRGSHNSISVRAAETFNRVLKAVKK
jgi:hypothetical protein